MTTLEVAEALPALALEDALDACVVAEWDAEAEAELDMDIVMEALDSMLEAEADMELEAAADDSEAEVGAAEVVAGAEEAAEEPEPTLAQKVWTAGRTWS